MTLDTLRTAFFAVLEVRKNAPPNAVGIKAMESATDELYVEILRQGQDRETFEQSWEAK